LSLPHKPLRAALLYDNSTSVFINIILTEGNYFYIIDRGTIIKEFKINSKNHINNFSLFADNEKGEGKILLNNGEKLEAYNLNGTLLDNFPIIESYKGNFISVPLTADLNGDGVIDIIAASDKGNLYAFDSKTTKVLENFPITIGTKIILAPAIYNYLPESMSPFSLQSLMMIDKNNYLLQWTIGIKSSAAGWNSEFSNSTNNSSITFSKIISNDKRFFPEEKVYNWPNPVYNDETFIRFYVSEDSEVKIKIFDLAGELVDELNDYAKGNYDNEIKWNVKNVQSGVYFANVEVKSASGKFASKVIKVAVIK